MITPHGLAALTQEHWFDAVAAMLRQKSRREPLDLRAQEALSLAELATRILTLDAEDFSVVAQGFENRPWHRRVRQCEFPHEPRAPERGALASLVPLYELMLEVLNIRSARHEPQAVVVTAHLIGEYLCQLAWEKTLGHAGDPLRMGAFVGQRWGTDDPECIHSSAMRSTAKRSLNACHGDVVAYTRYLDKFHSRLGDAMAVCAMNHLTTDAGERPDVAPCCPHPCSWATDWGSRDERRDLDARLRLAIIYLDSPLVALRHHAPVGHFFGVPSVTEISSAWLRTWERLNTQWADGSNPLVGATSSDADEVLPGMALLISTIAGRQISAGHIIKDVAADIVAALAQQ